MLINCQNFVIIFFTKKKAVFIISIWLAGMIVSIGAIIVEIANFIYLIFSSADLNFIGFGVELLAFVLLAAFCWTKYSKNRAAQEKSGPLITEAKKAEMKKNGKPKQKVFLCKEALPWLIAGISLYLAFLGAMVWTFVKFSWPVLGMAAVLVFVSAYCIYKYVKVKQDIVLAQEKLEILARKKAAREAAIERQKRKK